MRRSTFVASLGAGLGTAATCCSPALALDEGAIGHGYFQQLRDGGDILFDSPFYPHLNEIAEVVSNTTAPRYPYQIRFFIIKGDSANAFSVPGGNIYVNEPLLQIAGNKDELAGVLCHETGHMVLHHVARRIANANIFNTISTIGNIAAQILLGPLASIPASYAMDTAQQAEDMNLSRHIEAQADEEGARIMAATGVYNPYGMIWFFEKMIKEYGDRGTYWLRSHPFSSARITDLKNLYAANPQIFGKYDKTDREQETYW